MVFLLLFIAGGMVIPLLFDISKHGADNIFRRSGKDILRYEATRKVLRFFRVSTQRINASVLGALSLGAIVAVAFVAVKLVDLLLFVVRLFGG